MNAAIRASAPSTDEGATRPLRILHLVAAGAYGGLESVVSALTRGLVARGEDCRVLAILGEDDDSDSPFLAELRAGGVAILELRVAHRAYLQERRALRDHLAAVAPDVVHTHGFHADILAIPVAKRARRAVVSTVHGFTGGGLKMAIFEWLQERALARADRVVAVSRPIVRRLVGRGVDERSIRMMPNGWESHRPPLERAAARRQLGLSNEDRVIGWVGRLSHEKGADVFVRALAETPLRLVTGCVVGDGPERSVLEALARSLGVQDRVRFTGAVAGASAVYSAFDGFCLSSRTEGTPIAVLEAMHAGIPIVATRVGGVPDMIGSGEGWLVEPEDPAALAASLAAAIESGPGSAPTRAAARRLADDFALAPWIDRHLALYRELAGSERRPDG